MAVWERADAEFAADGAVCWVRCGPLEVGGVLDTDERGVEGVGVGVAGVGGTKASGFGAFLGLVGGVDGGDGISKFLGVGGGPAQFGQGGGVVWILARETSPPS